MITDTQFKTDREGFFKRLEAAKAKDKETQAIYAAHMSKAAHYLFLAGEMVKRCEFATVDFQHQQAAECIKAAIRCLPTGNSIGAATFAPSISL